MAKKIIIAVSAVLLVILVVFLGFFINYEVKAHRSTQTVGKSQTTYTADEAGDRIANIDYENYISEDTAPSGAVTALVSQTATGEENSEQINKAINEQSSLGGGVVVIPQGEYKVTTIELKSNVTLFVSYGAMLSSLSCTENEISSSPLNEAVVIANDAQNIAITGGGTIYGNGESYTNEAEDSSPLYALKEFNLYTRVIEARKRIRFSNGFTRNSIVKFNNCKNVKISNIILSESASWTLVLNCCDGVDISKTVIDNSMHVANTDGIDVAGSSDVSISSCFIATGDDGVVLKPSDKEISNVSVSDCVISSYANCFKIGTETQYDVSGVTVKDCYFFIPDGMTYGYSGIAIESADGSNISDITVENIEMDGVSSPILIWLGNRLNYDKQEVGSINGVVIKNITAKNTEMPSAITGCEVDGKEYSVENVLLENISVTYRDTGENLSVKRKVKEGSMSGYPEITRVSHRYFINHNLSGYWDLPCYAIYTRHTKNVDFSSYTCTPRTCNELAFTNESD